MSLPNSESEFWARCAVLIPAHNEEAAVAGAVAESRRLGCGLVVVVENGSADRTAEVARAAGAEVLQLPQAGYGHAVAAGQRMLGENWDWTLVVSADGSDAFAPGEADRWEAAAAGADLVLGDRTAEASSRAHLTPSQLWGSRLFSAVVRVVWGHCFQDMGSRRLIRNRRWPELQLREFQFGWNAEMQIAALEAGWTITELPASYHPRRQGESKISGNWRGTWRASLGILRCLGRLCWRYRLGASAAARQPHPSETCT